MLTERAPYRRQQSPLWHTLVDAAELIGNASNLDLWMGHFDTTGLNWRRLTMGFDDLAHYETELNRLSRAAEINLSPIPTWWQEAGLQGLSWEGLSLVSVDAEPLRSFFSRSLPRLEQEHHRLQNHHGDLWAEPDGRIFRATPGLAATLQAEGDLFTALNPALQNLAPGESHRGRLQPQDPRHYRATRAADGSYHVHFVAQLEDDPAFRTQQAALSVIRHELRSPLTAVRGLVEALYDEPDMPREDLHTFLQLLYPESERLVHWIEDLLLASALRLRPYPQTEIPVSATHLLAPVIDKLLPHAQQHRIRLELPPPAPFTIAVDPQLRDRFILNLVGHFLRLADPGADVRLHWQPDNSLIVQGEGPGIFSQKDACLWRDRARSTTSGKTVPAVGLGLILVRQIAAIQGWPLSVSHDGTLFSVQVHWPPARPENLDSTR